MSQAAGSGEGGTVQSKGFLDKVLQFMGIQEEALDDGSGEDSFAAAAKDPLDVRPEAKKRPRLVSLPGQGKGFGGMKVSVVYPKSYDDVQPIADHLKNRQPVILSLDGISAALSRRIIDFLSGVTYALEGHIHRIGDDIFLFAPVNVMIDAEEAFQAQDEDVFHR